MESNFNKSLELVLGEEGGYGDHPADPGGKTNLGITLATLTRWLGHPATEAQVRALTPASVTPIYKQFYWDIIKGDELPSGVDHAIFDYTVNSGPGRSVKDVQRLLGVTADGALGTITLAAIKAADPTDLITKLCDVRLTFLKGLKTWPTFGGGWGKRVVRVKAAALAMVRAEPIKPPILEAILIGGAVVTGVTAGTTQEMRSDMHPTFWGTTSTILMWLGIAALVVAGCVIISKRMKGK